MSLLCPIFFWIRLWSPNYNLRIRSAGAIQIASPFFIPLGNKSGDIHIFVSEQDVQDLPLNSFIAELTPKKFEIIS